MEEMRLSDSLNLTILEYVANLYGPVQLENLFYNKFKNITRKRHFNS